MIIDDDEEEEGRETRIALDQTQLLFCILRRPLLNTSELRLHFIWCFRADSLPPPRRTCLLTNSGGVTGRKRPKTIKALHEALHFIENRHVCPRVTLLGTTRVQVCCAKK